MFRNLAALAGQRWMVRWVGGILLLVSLGVVQVAGDTARAPELPALAVSGPADPGSEVVASEAADTGPRVLAIHSAPRLIGERCPDGSEAFAVPIPVQFPDPQVSPIPTTFPEPTVCLVAARP